MPATDQGASPIRYNLIPRTLIFLTRDEHVLLLKGAPQKRLWANRYNGIGGHVEQGEDILSAARRELQEESGLQNCNLWLCGVLVVDTGQAPGIGVFIFRGDCAQEQVFSSDEGQPEWIPYPEINRLPLVEDLYRLLPRVLAMQPGDPPFSARSSYDSNKRLIVRFSELE